MAQHALSFVLKTLGLLILPICLRWLLPISLQKLHFVISTGLYALAVYYGLLALGHFFSFNNVGNSKCDTKIDRYNELFTDGDEQAKREVAQQMTEDYYDLVTDFYEFGWGDSFHFAIRFKGEGLLESFRRHEYWLAHRAGIRKGQQWLDVGCGVGGPLRNIARFTGSKLTGLNLSAYQINRAKKLTAKANLSNLCDFKLGDFMKLKESFGQSAFDGAFSIEATPHAPDKVGCYKSILDVLKPGSVFAAYEWAMTSKFDPKDQEHLRIKYGIQHGDSLPMLPTTDEIVQSLKDAGFEVEETIDVAEVSPLNPRLWWEPVDSKFFGPPWRTCGVGLCATRVLVTLLEFLRIAPKGTCKAHVMLVGALEPLSAGGKLGIFTPAFYFKARKPLR